MLIPEHFSLFIWNLFLTKDPVFYLITLPKHGLLKLVFFLVSLMDLYIVIYNLLVVTQSMFYKMADQGLMFYNSSLVNHY